MRMIRCLDSGENGRVESNANAIECIVTFRNGIEVLMPPAQDPAARRVLFFRREKHENEIPISVRSRVSDLFVFPTPFTASPARGNVFACARLPSPFRSRLLALRTPDGSEQNSIRFSVKGLKFIILYSGLRTALKTA